MIPINVLTSTAAPLPLPLVDLGGLGAVSRQEREADRLLAAAASRLFDLAAGPLFRAVLLRLGATEHRLLVTQHHIVSDAWSVGLVARELAVFYPAFTAAWAAADPPGVPGQATAPADMPGVPGQAAALPPLRQGSS